MGEWSSFEPVLLDLARSEDYALLTTALYNHAALLEAEAAEELARAQEDALPWTPDIVTELRANAARVRSLIDDVERQLDANTAARRSEGKS